MTDQQWWDLAEFTCGRCFTKVTATTEREYVRLVNEHRATCTGQTAKDAR